MLSCLHLLLPGLGAPDIFAPFDHRIVWSCLSSTLPGGFPRWVLICGRCFQPLQTPHIFFNQGQDWAGVWGDSPIICTSCCCLGVEILVQSEHRVVWLCRSVASPGDFS